MIRALFAAFLILVGLGCLSPAEHHQGLHSTQEQQFTLGIVQAKIYKGMNQASVAESLGSPNIVTRDEAGDETWIYDKIATEASYSTDTGGVAGLGGGGGNAGSALLLGGLLGSYSRSSGAAASTQRTLTVVIKFNDAKQVKDFSYHASKF